MAEIFLRIGTESYTQVTKDPSDSKVYRVDWDTENLSPGATITTSTWAVTRLSGPTSPSMTMDGEGIYGGNRYTHVRLTGGALGSRWRVDHRITTNETPSQTKERSFYVLIEQR